MEQIIKHRWFVRVAAGAICLVLTVSAGWLWHEFSEETYEAHARVALPKSGGKSPAGVEEIILSPDVLAGAADLLRDREISLSLATPFDSAADYLLDHVRVEPPGDDAPDEIRIVCSAPLADEALQILSALVDAYLEVARHREPAAEIPAPAESEAERRHLAQAIERQEQALADLTDEIKARKEAAPTDGAADGDAGAGEDPAVGEAERVAARRAVAEAERGLAAARLDFETNLSPDVVALRLAEGPTRTRIIERLNLIRLKDELGQHEARVEKWSKVYGRNHPRMTEIRGQIEQLQPKIAALQGDAGEIGSSTAAADPSLMVIDILEADLAALQDAEREIETRLAARNKRLSAQHDVESKLGETRQELEFLYEEHNRLRQQLESARRREAGLVPDIVEQPTLSADRLAPQADFQMAVSGSLGIALYLLVLWQLRVRTQVVKARAAGNQASVAPRRERFRSQEEQRLARLKNAMRPEVAAG